MPLSAAQTTKRVQDFDADLNAKFRAMLHTYRNAQEEITEFLARGLAAALPAGDEDPVSTALEASTRKELIDMKAFLDDFKAVMLNDGAATLTPAQRATIAARFGITG